MSQDRCHTKIGLACGDQGDFSQTSSRFHIFLFSGVGASPVISSNFSFILVLDSLSSLVPSQQTESCHTISLYFGSNIRTVAKRVKKAKGGAVRG